MSKKFILNLKKNFISSILTKISLLFSQYKIKVQKIFEAHLKGVHRLRNTGIDQRCPIH
jgi:hypothetical protein